MSEAAIVRGVVAEIRERGGWVIKTTGVAETGTPDLVGTYRGRALAWEAKQPGSYPTPKQRHALEMAARAGADAAVVRSRLEARRRLDEIEERD